MSSDDNDQALLPFDGGDTGEQSSRLIRRLWHDGRWFFSVVDVVAVLTDNDTPRRYWSDLKRKLRAEGFESYEKIVQLKMRSLDGKSYATDAADVETMLRIIQPVPSPKAEPVKQVLAQAGAERLEEIAESDLLAGMTLEQRAIFLRGQMADRNTSLADAAAVSGVVTKRDLPCFRITGIRGCTEAKRPRILPSGRGSRRVRPSWTGWGRMN